ncbi:MAP3K12-binding inhibitory protein 1-like [Biomphalaria glabrata]|uniref:MAP3K12-binding inhibitory protein 1-like n=1 Tax=Biomphalaria glabrata TaxID=6526 RepID=A0A9W2ZW88_BIOGL|nr:MAP3K12-binding inhibitory protein 1-like [Biomphalaria glabrata]XP_055879242.1 MAP3K12-binding inhibitory protein 1-like [Biomphalaria glabrata]
MAANSEAELAVSASTNIGESTNDSDYCMKRFNPELIQIKAVNEEEVLRRIDAFIRNKRMEVNERNIREFISPVLAESDTSCARTEAIYVHREGEKSHISLKKVDNSYGPQTTRPAEDEDYDHRSYRHLPIDVQRADAVEERLRNMEIHLSLDSESTNIFSRIKALEQRISFLEGVSPEYFTRGVPVINEKSPEQSLDERSSVVTNVKQSENLNDINRRISQLKQVLKSKAHFINCYAD